MVSTTLDMCAVKAAGRWPALREELQLHHGPALADGQPSWTLHDPVRHRFVRIDWLSYEVLRRWWLGSPSLIAEQVNQQTTLSIDTAHVMQVVEFATQNELVQPAAAPKSSNSAKGVGAFGTWLLHHYLFFRIPLINPDRLLRRLLSSAEKLGSAKFTGATLLALMVGVILVLHDWTRFTHQAVDLFSWRGFALYGVTLIGVKVAHEFGHALVARHHGCRVPTMGIAFMVLWPVAYTDTSEVWRLADARARSQVALAGVRTEMSIAAWATLAWALLPDGPVRTAAFILATLTWVTTLLVNLSPFMRFDGYFVLCDALDQPNLHERCFAMARWWLRRLLLGWHAEPPEAVGIGAQRAMVAFAFATWAYRLMLYLGIAWLVYQFAIKAIGIVLFAVEIAWFIVLPIWRELKMWYAQRKSWRASRRARCWLLLGPALIGLGFVPIPSHESAGAVLRPAQHLSVRLPATAVLQAMHVKPGDQVAEGAALFQASAALLEQRRDAARIRIQQLQGQVAAASVDREQQSQWGSLQESLSTARQELAAAEQEMARLNPRAPFAATVLDVDPSARAGAVVGPQQNVLQLAAAGKWRIVAYASEAAVKNLAPGDEAQFMADAAPLKRISTRVVSVSPHASTWLSEPMLAQMHGGPIDAKQQGEHWLMAQPLYRVELEPATPPAISLRHWRGHVVLPQSATSVWQRIATAARNVFAREFGF